VVVQSSVPQHFDITREPCGRLDRLLSAVRRPNIETRLSRKNVSLLEEMV
jgi:hypothetical protein